MNESMAAVDAALQRHNPEIGGLEDGIASVFAAIQAEGPEDIDPNEPDSGATYALLEELNRIWASPSP
jgi:hypothetical protein